MTIEYAMGNIFAAEVDMLVNPVNTEGVSGAGLAAQFKARYPDNFEAYKSACATGRFHVGDAHLFITNKPMPRYIVNLPTKDKWREPSKLEYIQKGIESLAVLIRTTTGVGSVAIPALGCGLGGLQWADVNRVIIASLSSLSDDVLVLLFVPS